MHSNTEDQKVKLNAKEKTTLYLILIFIVFLIVVVIFGVISENNKASYKTTITNTEQIDPSTVRVYGSITNTSDVSGNPDCTAEAQNPSGGYRGWGMFNLEKELSPGETENFNVSLAITNNGAAYVTKASVSCK